MKLEQIVPWSTFDKIKDQLPNEVIKSWLLEEGAITKRIKLNYEFRLELIKDEISFVQEADKAFLGTKSSEIKLREVILYADEDPIVFAQTLIPNTTIENGLSELGNIGNKPLGDILFEKDIFTKSDQVFAEFVFKSNSFWGRKIKYTVKNEPFSVMEVFLVK
jgi:chorismate--pyruvate lyase